MPQAPLPIGSTGTTTTYGSDFSALGDFDANLTFLQNSPISPNAETIAVSQALARRLGTPNGGLFYDMNYGYDLRQFIGSSANPTTVAAGISAECRKDERVQDATATITVTGSGADEMWVIKINCISAIGPFQFTLNVSAVTVALLTGQT